MSKQFSNGVTVTDANKHKPMIIIVTDHFDEGDIVRLSTDDGSYAPYYNTIHSVGRHGVQTETCEEWSYMRPATAKELMAVGLDEDGEKLVFKYRLADGTPYTDKVKQGWFKVIDASHHKFNEGDVLKLDFDDKTRSPRFVRKSGGVEVRSHVDVERLCVMNVGEYDSHQFYLSNGMPVTSHVKTHGYTFKVVDLDKAGLDEDDEEEARLLNRTCQLNHDDRSRNPDFAFPGLDETYYVQWSGLVIVDEAEAVDAGRDEKLSEITALLVDIRGRVEAMEKAGTLRVTVPNEIKFTRPAPVKRVYKFSNGEVVDDSAFQKTKVFRITGNVDHNRHCYDIGTLVKVLDGWDVNSYRDGLRVTPCSGGRGQYVYWESIEPVNVSHFMRDGRPVTEDIINNDSRFEVMGHSIFPDGTVVRLRKNANQTEMHHEGPLFYYLDGRDFWYVNWGKLRLLNEAEVAELTKPKVEDWEPKGGEWYVRHALVSRASSTDECRQYGIEFETEEAAEKARKVLTIYNRLYKLAEELNEGWTPDWSDSNQLKFHVCFSHTRKVWRCDSCSSVDVMVPVFKDRATANRAVELITKHNALGDAAKGVYS